ncbi:hypothetical protein CMUS01_09273 [Colletotrichum musicola]|uniref:Uncharacterized protein n=1 Tax=Colletotrichum musicola TaxID=2175873 RepID=A0A8H6K924_9PEZI|nr:hypothetical protein CMUS01_09273 [Colletotrichum musicola]
MPYCGMRASQQPHRFQQGVKSAASNEGPLKCQAWLSCLALPPNFSAVSCSAPLSLLAHFPPLQHLPLFRYKQHSFYDTFYDVVCLLSPGAALNPRFRLSRASPLTQYGKSVTARWSFGRLEIQVLPEAPFSRPGVDPSPGSVIIGLFGLFDHGRTTGIDFWFQGRPRIPWDDFRLRSSNPFNRKGHSASTLHHPEPKFSQPAAHPYCRSNLAAKNLGVKNVQV